MVVGCGQAGLPPLLAMSLSKSDNWKIGKPELIFEDFSNQPRNVKPERVAPDKKAGRNAQLRYLV
jgi:hypothetical protein